MLKISFYCLGLSPAISEYLTQPEFAKNSLKLFILEFKVIQSHWCWHT